MIISGYFQVEYSFLYLIFPNFRLERDSKLSELEERADALQDGSAQFEKQAGALKNKFWLENLKSMIAMGVVAVIVLGLLYWHFATPAAPPAYAPPPPAAVAIITGEKVLQLEWANVRASINDYLS